MNEETQSKISELWIKYHHLKNTEYKVSYIKLFADFEHLLESALKSQQERLVGEIEKVKYKQEPLEAASQAEFYKRKKFNGDFSITSEYTAKYVNEVFDEAIEIIKKTL